MYASPGWEKRGHNRVLQHGADSSVERPPSGQCQYKQAGTKCWRDGHTTKNRVGHRLSRLLQGKRKHSCQQRGLLLCWMYLWCFKKRPARPFERDLRTIKQSHIYSPPLLKICVSMSLRHRAWSWESMWNQTKTYLGFSWTLLPRKGNAATAFCLEWRDRCIHSVPCSYYSSILLLWLLHYPSSSVLAQVWSLSHCELCRSI